MNRTSTFPSFSEWCWQVHRIVVQPEPRSRFGFVYLTVDGWAI